MSRHHKRRGARTKRRITPRQLYKDFRTRYVLDLEAVPPGLYSVQITDVKVTGNVLTLSMEMVE